ncbi:glutamate--tRNA ligase [Candidatus Babeliales bacterium]|nr:glutamate--tRNA ligase [Candidatus Babeliales bacterium]
MAEKIRVRFAPSPTGFMHLGNVRAALMNYLFAKNQNGTFILRIEDTDEKRNLDEARAKILSDLEWLGLEYTEGPYKGGPYEPYLQSEREHLYQEKLALLIDMKRAYRCFCTIEELEHKRARQIALKQPPRYDRTCLRYTEAQIQEKLAAALPFIWRCKIEEGHSVTISDMAKGNVLFDMKNFSDFALTRTSGTSTFMFANFVDDWLMEISHVIRGEDHLTNTAMQAELYHAFSLPLPIFWHLPIICNSTGEKLSKRDFGFSLEDLKEAGFLPAAIVNYLAIIGASFKEEIQSLEELGKNFDFSHLHASSSMKYDLEKLTWINHQWISRTNSYEMMEQLKGLLHKEIPASSETNPQELENLITLLKPELKTLNDIVSLAAFYFDTPIVHKEDLVAHVGAEKTEHILRSIEACKQYLPNTELFLEHLKTLGKEHGISMKELFGSIRYLLTGQFQGIGIKDLLNVLQPALVEQRLSMN